MTTTPIVQDMAMVSLRQPRMPMRKSTTALNEMSQEVKGPSA